MRAAQEDDENDLRSPEYFTAPGPCENFSCVGHVVDVWVPQLEVAYHKACCCGDRTETDDEDTTGDHAQASEH